MNQYDKCDRWNRLYGLQSVPVKVVFGNGKIEGFTDSPAWVSGGKAVVKVKSFLNPVPLDNLETMVELKDTTADKADRAAKLAIRAVDTMAEGEPGDGVEYKSYFLASFEKLFRSKYKNELSKL